MKVSSEEIRKVLALFDEEDIKYIDFDFLLKNKILEITDDNDIKEKPIVKTKKIGGKK